VIGGTGVKNSIKELELEIEIALTKLDIRETKILIKKYEKKVSKEKEKLKKKYKYESQEELREAFENDVITLKEFDKIQNYFESQEKSINEIFLEYLKRNNAEDLKHLKRLEDELLVEIARS